MYFCLPFKMDCVLNFLKFSSEDLLVCRHGVKPSVEFRADTLTLISFLTNSQT